MKIKTKCIINTGLYMHLEAEIEIDVPDNLKNENLVKWLHMQYHGLLTMKENHENNVCQSCGGLESLGTGGEKIINGLHNSCRKNESYKKQNL